MLRFHLSSRHLIATSKNDSSQLTLQGATPHCSHCNSLFCKHRHSSPTSINSSTPAAETVASMTNSLSIANLSPPLQQQFSLLVQHYINHVAVQPNLLPASNCDNRDVPTSTLPQSYNATALTFTQASVNHTFTTNAPLYKVTGQHPTTTTYQLQVFNTSAMLLQLQNPLHTLSHKWLAAYIYTTANNTNHYFTAPQQLLATSHYFTDTATITSCYFSVATTITCHHFTTTATTTSCYFTITAIDSCFFTATAISSPTLPP